VASRPTLAHRRIDLAAVAASLRRLQRELHSAHADIRDPLDDQVVENMVAGYALVDVLVADGVDVFAPGRVVHLLELNTVVLCGTSPARHEQYAGHLEATERRFYEERAGGIGDLVEWCRIHADDPPWEHAAGLYLRLLSKPQLFIEGNHRTGALVMSYVLVRHGQPPFVLSADCAAAYFDPSAAIRDTDKGGAAMLFRGPALRQQLARMLEAHSDPRHLRP